MATTNKTVGRENTQIGAAVQEALKNEEAIGNHQSLSFVVPDPNEIRPYRLIPQKEIDEVIQWHLEMFDLRRMALNRAIKIGFKLRCWHDLIPHGKWLKWLKANLPIEERMAQRYLQLWDNHEVIERHFGDRFNSDCVSDLDEVVGVREALEFLTKTSRRAAGQKRKTWPSDRRC